MKNIPFWETNIFLGSYELPLILGVWKPGFSYVCINRHLQESYERPNIYFQINSEETTWLKFVKHEECEYVSNFMFEVRFGRYMLEYCV